MDATPQQQQVETPMTTAHSNGSTDGSLALKGGEAGATVTAVPTSFRSYLRALRSAWTDLPDLTISYADLTTEVQVAATSNASGEGELPSVTRFLGEKAGALARWLTRSDSSSQTRSFRPLEACTGIVRPGELVLVLGAPGCGKVREKRNSTAHRSLAARSLQCAALADPRRWAGLGRTRNLKKALRPIRRRTRRSAGSSSCPHLAHSNGFSPFSAGLRSAAARLCLQSTLLKALAGRLNPVGRAAPQEQQGDLRWNGMTAAECAAAGLQLNRLTAFVDQGDIRSSHCTSRTRTHSRLELQCWGCCCGSSICFPVPSLACS